MVLIRDLANFNKENDLISAESKGIGGRVLFWMSVVFLVGLFLIVPDAFADGTIPGEKGAANKLEAAGTLLRIVDTALFSWGAKIFAGICIMSSGWALKEQRFGIAVISIVGAIIFGTAPTWVKNIFDIGESSTLFSMMDATGIQLVFLGQMLGGVINA